MKYSTAVLAAVYLFFSVQLIKSDKKKDKGIGIFFYVFPLVVAAIYYLSDINSAIQLYNEISFQEKFMLGSALITLLLAFVGGLYQLYHFRKKVRKDIILVLVIPIIFGIILLGYYYR